MTGAAAAARAARPDAPEFFTVNQLAEELGVTARAIRFYEAKGLIAPSRAGTTRVFDRRDRARLMLVLRGKRLGFSLARIREFLDLYDADRTQAAQLRLLLASTRERIRELEQQRVDLDQTLRELREVEAEAERMMRKNGGSRVAAGGGGPE
jgi:DNA-binding transcriptional MerR regulator